MKKEYFCYIFIVIVSIISSFFISNLTSNIYKNIKTNNKKTYSYSSNGKYASYSNPSQDETLFKDVHTLRKYFTMPNEYIGVTPRILHIVGNPVSINGVDTTPYLFSGTDDGFGVPSGSVAEGDTNDTPIAYRLGKYVYIYGSLKATSTSTVNTTEKTAITYYGSDYCPAYNMYFLQHAVAKTNYMITITAYDSSTDSCTLKISSWVNDDSFYAPSLNQWLGVSIVYPVG